MSSLGPTRIQFEDPMTVLPLVQEVPNGSLILVRRSEYGCDVTVLPPLSDTGAVQAAPPIAGGPAIACGMGVVTPEPVQPFTAEQIVDLMAEAIATLLEGMGRGRLSQSDMASPSWRLAQAAGIDPKCLRDLSPREARMSERQPSRQSGRMISSCA